MEIGRSGWSRCWRMMDSKYGRLRSSSSTRLHLCSTKNVVPIVVEGRPGLGDREVGMVQVLEDDGLTVLKREEFLVVQR